MEHRGIDFTVLQGIQRGVWKWSAFVAGARIFGQESCRSVAMAAAESAIDRALADPRKTLLGKSVAENPCTEELNSLKLALSTFALKLDAFEARLKLRRGQKPKRVTAPDLVADPAAVADVALAKPGRAGRRSRRRAGISGSAPFRSTAVR
jgi:hypothetical protein